MQPVVFGGKRRIESVVHPLHALYGFVIGLARSKNTRQIKGGLDKRQRAIFGVWRCFDGRGRAPVGVSLAGMV